MDLTQEISSAALRIRPYVRETYLERSLSLEQRTGCKAYLKLENLQHTGSFKVRGAMSKALSLTAEQRSRGVVAASTGNHGAAVAYCAERLGLKGTVFVPEIASPTKVEAIRRLGADVRFEGSDCVEAEIQARRYAQSCGKTYISPYNDIQVIAGQGTIGVELAKQLGGIDVVFVALGGGGLISGIAAYLKGVGTDVTIVGCSPENSCVMVESMKAGRILDLESSPTLSDGTAGGIEPGSVTFGLCRGLVDDYILVTEQEIRDSLVFMMENHHLMIEGAAAVAVAAFLKTAARYEQKNVVIIVCGANIGLDVLNDVLAGRSLRR